MQDQPPTIEQIEEEMYQALLAEVPDLSPYTARGLAKTAADNMRDIRAANQKTLTAHQISLETPRSFPEDKNENDQ